MYKAKSFEQPKPKQDTPSSPPYSDPVPRKKPSSKTLFSSPIPYRQPVVGDIDQDYASYSFLTNLAPKTLLEDEASLNQDDSGQVLPRAPNESRAARTISEPYLLLYNREMTRGKSPTLTTSPNSVEALCDDLANLTMEPQMKALIKKAKQSQLDFKQAMIQLAKEFKMNKNQALWDNFQYYRVLYPHLSESELTEGLVAFNQIHKLEVKDMDFILKLLAPNLMYMAKIQLLKTLRNVYTAHWELKAHPEQPNQYLMVNSENPKDCKPLTQSTYQIVVIHDHQLNRYKTYIGRGFHYQIAQKKKLVAFAGNIETNSDGAIVSINDLSGAYHSRPEESPAILRKKSMSIPQVLFAAGLPGEKFVCTFPQADIPLHTPKSSLRSQWRTSI